MSDNLYGFTISKITNNKYQVSGNNCPSDMTITVKRANGGYRAECNYSIQNRNAANSYQAMHCLSTPEETIKHLLISLQPTVDSKWVKV
jgi:hypothetical protein